MLRDNLPDGTVKEHRRSSVSAYTVVRLACEPPIITVAADDMRLLRPVTVIRPGTLRHPARRSVSGRRTEQHVLVIGCVRLQGKDP